MGLTFMMNMDYRPGTSLSRATRRWLTILILTACVPLAHAQPVELADNSSGASAGKAAGDGSGSGALIMLGIGDAISVQVYGRPELAITTYVADDGTVAIPLAGDVAVNGLSPAKAAQRIATAFRVGKLLVDPQVSVLMVQHRSQQVSVLGAVRSPGRFVVESRTTVLDVLAQAGGITETGGDVVVVVRAEKGAKPVRHTIELEGLMQSNMPLPTFTLRGGDSIFVPPAEQFYIYGEVRTPNMYKLEKGMTVLQAISRGGGITARGSSRRIEIKRRNPNGSYQTREVSLSDTVQANDVIRVKESFF